MPGSHPALPAIRSLVHVMPLFERHRVGSDDLGFFLLWLRRPGRVGALLPSGRALAAAMAEQIDRDAPGYVVELGGGTGAITRAILEAEIPSEDLVVVEREARLCRVIRRRYPKVTVLHGDARSLDPLLRRAEIAPVKAVVSSLPLIPMDRDDRETILEQAFRALDRNGEFIQFTYSPASPVPRQTLARLGLTGRRSEWVFNNLPPASIWRYRRVCDEAEVPQVA